MAHRKHVLDRFPGDRWGAGHHVQRRLVDAIIAELNAAGSALPFATFLGGSNPEGGVDVARDPTGNIYVAGSTFSQDFPATVGAFDRVFNGDLSIFWGDAFVTKIDINATTSTPPSPPGLPAAPTLLTPSNASSQPQPIQFDWNDVAEAVSYEIQIDDSSAFSAPLVRDQNVTSSFLVITGLATGDPLVAGPWRQLGGHRRRVVGRANLHAAGRTAAGAVVDRSTSTRPRSKAATPSAGTVVTDVSAPPMVR